MKRIFLFGAILFAVCLSDAAAAIPAAGAAASSFSFRLGCRSASGGDTVALEVRLGAETPVAAFRVRVSYDDSVLSFAGAETSQAVESGTMQTNPDIDPIYSVYVCNAGKGYAPKLSGTVVTYLFRVRNGAAAGETDLCACVDETYDYSEQDMPLDACATLPLEIKPASSATARLTALEPSQGQLEPAFSPEVFSYRLRVDASVRSIVFQADAAENGRVRVSRKTLLAAGEDTPIQITVISADGKTQAEYFVTVSRAAKPAAESKVSAASKQISSISHSSAGPRHTQSNGNSAAEQALEAARKGRKKQETSVASSTFNALGSTEKVSAGYPGTIQTAGVSAPAAAPLTVVKDGMPSYVVGMLTAGFCIVIGVLLSMWFAIRK